MNSSPTHDQHREAGRGMLAFSFLGGSIAWLLHLLLAYLVSEFGCLSGMRDIRFLNITAVAWMLFGITLLALAAAAAATYASWRKDLSMRHPQIDMDDVAATDFYLIRSGLIANASFVFIILVQSVPIFYFLREC